MFLTHLDMEFPELSHIAALVKGDVTLSACFAVSLNLSVTLQLRLLKQISRRRTPGRDLDMLFP